MLFGHPKFEFADKSSPNVNFSINIYAKFPKSRPKLAKFGQNSIFSGEIQISEP
jgi:hypothetical protein